ncbi:MAG: HtpX-2 peptidase [Alphaproteobacteria bacterium]|nr:HtpX-2 peptidase [Alphaproteobacteria bacterium]
MPPSNQPPVNLPGNPWEDAPETAAPVNPWDDGPSAMAFTASEDNPGPPIETGRVDALDFLEAIRRNERNTWFLMIAMLLLAGGFGYVLGWGWDAATKGTLGAGMNYMAGGRTDWGRLILTPSQAGITLGLSFLAGMSVWSLLALWRADSMVLRMAQAQEAPPESHAMLHNVVEEMAIAAGLPKPKIVIMPTHVPNAFATGMRPEKATIGVTAGLLKTLNRRELQGVVAHEMGHIVNSDMRYATILAVMTGVLVFIAQIVLNFRQLMFIPSGDRDRRGGNNALVMIIMVVIFMVTAILVPIIARFIQMAVSRQREYLADATAVRLTRDPGGLISALKKISEYQEPSLNLNQAMEPLFIITPVKMLQNGNLEWFSTHPPVQKRIERLKALE